jgi:BirA family biotin operon repressor/biotin-[acetyl-CoA-carboxylase] ligase
VTANPYHAIESAKPGTIGWCIHYLETATSTQDIAAQLARDGAASGTVVIAETQTAGRGRKARQWYSPPGVNLYLTVILRPKIIPAELPRVSLAAGLAVAQTLDSVAPGMVQLKWPNDVWLRGKKVAGILAQAVNVDTHETTVVLLGIGINVNLAAGDILPELRDAATSVRIEVGAPCDRVMLAAALFARLNAIIAELERDGFSEIRARWEGLSALTGKTVKVLDYGPEYTGKVKGIDENGALLLETKSNNLVRLRAGEVTLSGSWNTRRVQA